LQDAHQNIAVTRNNVEVSIVERVPMFSQQIAMLFPIECQAIIVLHDYPPASHASFQHPLIYASLIHNPGEINRQ